MHSRARQLLYTIFAIKTAIENHITCDDDETTAAAIKKKKQQPAHGQGNPGTMCKLLTATFANHNAVCVGICIQFAFTDKWRLLVL